MRRRSLPAAVALALALACDGNGVLALREAPSFREVEAPEGRALAAQPGTHVLQAGSTRRGPVAGAHLVEPDGVWPEEASDGAPVIILAPDDKAGYRLAARMARAGIEGIVLVSGGLEAWLAQDEETDEIAAVERRTQRE